MGAGDIDELVYHTGIAFSLDAAYQLLYTPARQREYTRQKKKKDSDLQRAKDGEAKRRLAREIFSEYTPGDIKRLGGKEKVHKEIGELIAKRMDPPLSKPVPAGTVRMYLTASNSEIGSIDFTLRAASR
jgi:hypothetical protein